MDYVLPLKAGADDDLDELGRYVERLTHLLRVIVVDGSAPAVFTRNATLLGSAIHVPPSPAHGCPNGKVAGVRTGLALCASDKVVVADDDVRYEPDELRELERLLDEADLVVPQNYYDPMTWPAWLDTPRSLINRALPSGDFPGTLGLRLTPRLRTLGYRGDVLFENLELIRTVQADGGRVRVARELYVRRRPPSGSHYAGQRVRQAYDSLAQPVRLAAELALLPLGLLAGRRARRLLAAAAAVAVGAAECGRRRARGRVHFPVAASLLAPLWLAERAVCAWVAVARRMVAGGTVYAGSRIKWAATPVATLQRERARACGSRRTPA